MSEFHFIRDERVRRLLENIGLILGAIGVIIAILSFIY